jgi:hypothetical protein
VKKCKVCKTEFTPTRPMQKVCSPTCALEVSRQVAQKKAAKEAQDDRKKTREKLDAMRTKPQLVKVAQTAFNAFVRARDLGRPCISCGAPLSTEPNSHDCGHFRSVGSSPHMRFVEDNAHSQCRKCNNWLSGNVLAYRKGLIERIGLARVEQIESDQTVRKYTKEALQEIARHYNAETRRLKKEAI